MTKVNQIAKRMAALAWLLAIASASQLRAAPSSPAPALAAETALLRMTNAVRSERGLASLRWDPALAEAARAHAEWMARNDRLSHRLPGEDGLALRAAQAGAHFQAIAENVAIGPGVDALQQGWMRSSPHRANILDPGLNAVGIAVVDRGGSLFAVADFSRAVQDLSLDQVEGAVARLILSEGIQPNGPRLDARQTCEMNHGIAGGSHPRFVSRWQSSDLSRLPDSLERELKSDNYRAAAVGACASANAESGFTTYRVAVLLYR